MEQCFGPLIQIRISGRDHAQKSEAAFVADGLLPAPRFPRAASVALPRVTFQGVRNEPIALR